MVGSFFFAIYISTFCVAHWMIAFTYKNVGDDMPYILKEEIPPEEKHCGRKTLNYVIVGLNIVIPVTQQVLDCIVQFYKIQVPPRWLTIPFDISVYAVFALLLFSCFYLIRSVVKIRKYLTDTTS